MIIEEGVFSRTNDAQTAAELLLFIENLDEMNCVIKSDHILNLLPEVEGNLLRDKSKIISILDEFLSLSPQEQMIYQVGRRVGYMGSTKDLHLVNRRKAVERSYYV